jgi:hypothetical protein
MLRVGEVDKALQPQMEMLATRPLTMRVMHRKHSSRDRARIAAAGTISVTRAGHPHIARISPTAEHSLSSISIATVVGTLSGKLHRVTAHLQLRATTRRLDTVSRQRRNTARPDITRLSDLAHPRHHTIALHRRRDTTHRRLRITALPRLEAEAEEQVEEAAAAAVATEEDGPEVVAGAITAGKDFILPSAAPVYLTGPERHFFDRRKCWIGGDIHIAQRLAGQSNVKTTQLYYRRRDEVSFRETEKVGISCFSSPLQMSVLLTA